MSPLLRALTIAVGLLVAEMVVPIAIAYPFASHEEAMYEKARAQYQKEDNGRISDVLNEYLKTHSTRHPELVTPGEYRAALVHAAQTMKTDMGALGISDDIIDYLAVHPEDKELQNIGIAMLDRARAYHDATFMPIYKRVERIDTVRELSLAVRMTSGDWKEKEKELQTLVPNYLTLAKLGMLHPTTYITAQDSLEKNALPATTAAPTPTSKAH
jgi:hypothetical protein